MRNLLTMTLIISAVLLTSACASSEEWVAWKSHATHFASAEHMRFSLVNDGKKAVRVSRGDVALAHSQGWWGDPVTAAQGQIIER